MFQMRKMSGDRRLRELQHRHEIAHAKLFGPHEQGKDTQANFFRERLKGQGRFFHAEYISA